MSEKRFFTKINKKGRNVIIDKECHIEIIDLTLACEVLNRLDLKLKTYNEQLGEQQATIEHLTKSRDKWSKSAKLHSEYFNCLEKAIEIAYEEKPYPKIEDIMTIYSKLEKEINDE